MQKLSVNNFSYLSSKTLTLKIVETLKLHHLKATPQRLVIMQVLSESAVHPTAEQLFEQVQATHPTISLGTIYKTLETLHEAGLAQKVHVADSAQRWDANIHPHHHIFCSDTGEIVDFEDEELDRLINNYFLKKNISNFTPGQIQLQLNGVKINPNQPIKYHGH